MAEHQTNSQEKIKDLHQDLKTAQELEAMTKTPGGQALLRAAATDVQNQIQVIRHGFRTMTHAELIAECASLAANLVIYETLTSAKKNVDFLLDELKELVPDDDTDAS